MSTASSSTAAFNLLGEETKASALNAKEVNQLVKFSSECAALKDLGATNVALGDQGVYAYTVRADPTAVRVLVPKAKNARKDFTLHTAPVTAAECRSLGRNRVVFATGSSKELCVWTTVTSGGNSVEVRPIATFAGAAVTGLSWASGTAAYVLAVVFSESAGAASVVGLIDLDALMGKKKNDDNEALALTAADIVKVPVKTALKAAAKHVVAVGAAPVSKLIVVGSKGGSELSYLFSSNHGGTLSIEKTTAGDTLETVAVTKDFLVIAVGSKGSVTIFNPIDTTITKGGNDDSNTPIFSAQAGAGGRCVAAHANNSVVLAFTPTAGGAAAAELIIVSAQAGAGAVTTAHRSAPIAATFDALAVVIEEKAVVVVGDAKSDLSTVTVQTVKEATGCKPIPFTRQPVLLEGLVPAVVAASSPAAAPAAAAPARQQQGLHSPSHKPAGTAGLLPPPTLPAYQDPTPLPTVVLRNTALASVVAIPKEVQVAAERVCAAITDGGNTVRKAISDTSVTIAAFPAQQRRDMEHLIKLALEAQVQALQPTAVAGAPVAASAATPNITVGGLPVPRSATASSATTSSALNNQAIDEFTTSLANHIAEAIILGVSKVGEAAKQAVADGLAAGTKKSGGETLKKRLDQTIGEVGSAFEHALSEKFKLAEKQLENGISTAVRPYDNTVKVLARQVEELSAQLDAFSRSGILDEVKRLRAEVAKLKAAALKNSSAAGSGKQQQAVNVMTPETIISAAVQAIHDGSVADGLAFAVAAGLPMVTAAVLLGVKRANTVNLADAVESLPYELLVNVSVSALTGAASVDEATAVLEFVASLDACEEQQEATPARLKAAIKPFVAQWRKELMQASNNGLKNMIKAVEIM